MCGVAGQFGSGDPLSVSRIVSSIVQDQVARGPDHQAVRSYGDGIRCATLGHDRLSIVDLSTDANQPMMSTDGRFHIVYNGEIYNYRELRAELVGGGAVFRTASDTEVLLTAFVRWGSAALVRCNGMFAFAIYDAQEHVLWLGRDRFGVKPLYYLVRDHELYFASTGRELARHFHLVPDLAYVSRGLSFGVYEDDTGISQYNGLHALPASHVLEARVGIGGDLTVRLSQYYNVWERAGRLREELAGDPPAALLERFRGTLEDAVAIRLRADVPVGVSISGGLDSSSIACMAARQTHRVSGFCYGSPEAPESEGPLVAALAAERAIDVHYAWEEYGRSSMADAYWRTLEAQDAPIPSGSVIAQNIVFSAARAAGFKVLLGGQGGDEALMGYHKYRLLQLRQLLTQQRYLAVLRAGVGLVPAVMGLRRSLSALWWHRKRYLNAGGARHRLLLPKPAPLSMAAPPAAPLWERQTLDVVKTSLPSLLRYEDRNSMGSSVESRLPFLDYRIIELGLALPESQKLRSGWGKWILRAAMMGELPDQIRLNPAKRGFDANESAWIRSGLGKAMRERLHDAQSRIGQFLPTDASIERWYSDDALSAPGNAFCEAGALLWLAGRA